MTLEREHSSSGGRKRQRGKVAELWGDSAGRWGRATMAAATLRGDISGSGGQQWRREAAVGEKRRFVGGRQRWWREAAVEEGGRNARESTVVVGAATLGGASNGGIQRASKQSRQRSLLPWRHRAAGTPPS